MSKYTTELRFICEHAAGLRESAGYSKVNEIIEKAIPVVFDFDFPMFDEEYKNVLCGKILKHYYTREICCETVGRWKLFLEEKMNRIMPYYNELYESAKLKYDPLLDYNMTVEHKGGDTHDGSSTGDSKNTSTYRYSDTPQGGLEGVQNWEYLTEASETDNGSNVQNSVKATNTNEYITITKGKGWGGTYAKLVKEYRETLINIDDMIIGELKDLFFGLW